MSAKTFQFGVSRRQVLGGIAAGAGRSLLPASLLMPATGHAATSFDDGLLRGSADEANVDTRTVLNFIDHVFGHDLDLHSFMLFRHGKVVAEGWSWPYQDHRPHITHSLTKSVMVCAVGLAMDEGHFALDDKVVSFFEDELPANVSSNLEAMTVRDLLTMRAGHAESVSGSVFRPIKTSWIAEFFKIPVVHKPGQHFLYSSALSFMLSAIVTRTTGESVRDYLQPRMFEPLGISGLTWGSSPQGISSGGNGLTWKTADSLKLGILHLQKGKWNGQQILPERWIEEATRVQIPNGNYGYQWWVNEEKKSYQAEGAFGQFSVVFPEHDAVVAITAGVQSGNDLMDRVWEFFPAAFEGTSSANNADSERELNDRLTNMRLLPLARGTTSPLVEKINGRTYTMEANDDNVSSVQLDFSGDELLYRLSDHRGDHVVRVGIHDWVESTTGITGNKLHHQYQSDDMRVVAHGRWWDERTFEMTWQFVETAWVDHVQCRFFDDRISIDRRTNANYAPPVAETIRGRLSNV